MLSKLVLVEDALISIFLVLLRLHCHIHPLRMIYIPLITECPYHETGFGFSDRNARNNHQLTCRYRSKNPLQVVGVGGLIPSQLGSGSSNNNVNMPLGESRNFSASLTNQNQNFSVGDMNVPSLAGQNQHLQTVQTQVYNDSFFYGRLSLLHTSM